MGNKSLIWEYNVSHSQNNETFFPNILHKETWIFHSKVFDPLANYMDDQSLIWEYMGV